MSRPGNIPGASLANIGQLWHHRQGAIGSPGDRVSGTFHPLATCPAAAILWEKARLGTGTFFACIGVTYLSHSCVIQPEARLSRGAAGGRMIGTACPGIASAE